MRGASEAREHAAHLRNIRDHFRSGRFGQREVWERQLEAAALTLDRLTAPSAGTGEGLAAVYEECARIAESHDAYIVAAELREVASAAPSPSRREPTREEYAAAICERMDDGIVRTGPYPLHTSMSECACWGAAAAVLALYDRAGKE